MILMMMHIKINNKMKRFLLLLFSIFVYSLATAQVDIRYTSANLNMRFGPGTNYQVLTTVPKGTMVTIDEDCNCQWVPIEYNGKIGYISTSYLVKEKNSSKAISSPSEIKYYTNSKGEKIQSPTRYKTAPAGATALCRDGTYSFSKSRRGTCSHHGGVAKWL